MKPYIEKDCRCCGNCSGDECLKYGAATDVAVELCAQEAFRNYVQREHTEQRESVSVTDLQLTNGLF